MSDPQKSRRKWFQFHLSTFVISMLMAGGFVGLNVAVHHPPFDSWDGLDQMLGDGFIVSKTSVGFPFPIYATRVWRDPHSVQGGVSIPGIVLNLVILAFSILAVNVCFELLIWCVHRREYQNT